MLLRDWLREIGFQTRILATAPLDVGDADVLFVLGGETGITTAESAKLRTWVQSGKTLIVAGTPAMANQVLSAFQISLTTLRFTGTGPVLPSSPTLKLPSLDKIPLDAAYRISTQRTDLAAHYLVQGYPILASFTEGRGTVWVAGGTYPFTNEGLGDTNRQVNAKLVINMLAGVSPDAVIAFDETIGTVISSSGSQADSATSQNALDSLLSSPAGWGLILAVGLTLTYLALRGQRFGQAVPLPDDRVRREPVEYIQAMANLWRRSGQRPETQRHYSARLRRALSERYGIDPKLNDAELVRIMAARDSDFDVALLRDVLARLADHRLSEQALVKLAMDVNQLLRSVK